MKTIRETDIMIICLEAAKNLSRDYNIEVEGALSRIAHAMYPHRGEVMITRAEDNPVERDIIARVTSETVKLVLGIGDE